MTTYQKHQTLWHEIHTFNYWYFFIKHVNWAKYSYTDDFGDMVNAEYYHDLRELNSN